jgi:hypothetical protein
MTLLNIYISIICICFGFLNSNFEFILEKLHSTKDYVRNYQLFLQNKPKVKCAQINVSSFITNKYVKMDTWLSGKNKANQSQSNPIQSQFTKRPKMNLNIYPTMVYSNKLAIRRKQNKPNQTQFQTQLLWMPAEIYLAQSVPRTEFTPHFDAGMLGCAAGITMLEDNP